LKEKYPSLLGRLGAESKRANSAEARLQLQEDTAAALAARAELAEQERDTLAGERAERERKERLAGIDDGEDLTDEELESYDPKDLRMIRGLNKRHNNPVLKSLLAEVDNLKAELVQLKAVGTRVTEIGRSHDAMAHQAAASAEREYFTKVLTPHFPEWEKWVKTPEWKSFLAVAENDDPSVQKGHLLAHYRKSKFVPGMVGLFKEFEARTGQTAQSGLSGLVTPMKTSAERTPVAKPAMKSSEYVKMLNAFSRSKSISKEQWEKYKATFQTARLEGRVEDDAKVL
jgi:hypothetical protein